MRLPDAVKDAVWERDRSRCFRCGLVLHRNQSSYSIQHRVPGQIGGSPSTATRLSNLILLCGSATTLCHGWVEKNRTASEVQGFIVRRPADPAAVPVNRWQRVWVLLADDGTIHQP